MCLDSARETPGEPGLGTAPPHGHAGDAPDEPGVAPAEFRRALARHAAGTVVVTGPGPWGSPPRRSPP
ncbi:hypothetical protein [Thermocatellispora tengchongensis]|uniref:hypothetical protein n=1 Tax=Thermocatellispora tengchongensis TaxID=1073253 RepID=UPI0036295E88